MNNEHTPESISRLVLASSSPRRKELVASLDLSLPVYILSTDADETILEHWSPQQAVEELSVRKAQAALDMLPKESSGGDLIIAADTIVVLDGEILGKPQHEQEAIETLAKLSGRQHDVYTGVAVLLADSGKMSVSHRHTKVWMKELGLSKIKRYVETGEPLDKAGSYGIQGIGATLVDKIEGCYYSVMGLPVSLLSDMLEQYGVRVLE
ncbi:Maf family protein [Paenibacillus sp. GCM10027627]|uniref:Maf family protein n=1 Tax=unclassified Paenibacillus TaxID=185978 RepID=UPI00364065A0